MWRRFGSLLLLLLCMIAASCSSADDSASSSEAVNDVGAALQTDSDGGDATEAAAEAEEAPAPEDRAADLGAGATPVAIDTADLGRDIIRTAQIEIEVDDMVVASQAAMTAIEGLGGLLFNQTTTTQGTPRSTLTFKVQPADFSEAIERLSGVGLLRDQIITADDVTERVVDLQSRVTTSEASVLRLREFLAEAQTLEAIAQIEAQLLQRETDLELLRGQLRTIQNQVSLATITVTLTERQPGPALDMEMTAYLDHDGGATCPGGDDLEVDENDTITLCYELTNTGDTFLGEITLQDGGYDLEPKDFSVHRGSLDEPLAPGEQVVLFAEVEARYREVGNGQATAVPVDENGNDLRIETVSARDSASMVVSEDTSIPGFMAGLEAGIGLLATLIAAAILALGAFLPFIWVPPLIWWFVRWNRRRVAAKPKPEPTPAPVAPVPPAPVAPVPPAPGYYAPPPAPAAATPAAPTAPTATPTAAQDPAAGTAPPTPDSDT